MRMGVSASTSTSMIDGRAALHLIRGVTNGGKVFRPSDWPERLAGVIALFVREKKPAVGLAAYSFAVPLVEEGVRCLSVAPELASVCPEAFDFVIRFAADNALPVQTRYRAGSSSAGKTNQAAAQTTCGAV
ncbi:DUF3579 domain-containing protein [Trinickia sp. EG282A]|uniref:DUF3579 domain-containing protein n=1 Tax=Trinickia sp. EG282A TaxID=3237013 RepID=UPI0034D1C1A6